MNLKITISILIIFTICLACRDDLPHFGRQDQSEERELFYSGDFQIYDSKNGTLLTLGMAPAAVARNYGSDLALTPGDSNASSVKHIKIMYSNDRSVLIDLARPFGAGHYRSYRGVRLNDSYNRVKKLYPQTPFRDERNSLLAYISDDAGIPVTAENLSQYDPSYLRIMTFSFKNGRLQRLTIAWFDFQTR